MKIKESGLWEEDMNNLITDIIPYIIDNQDKQNIKMFLRNKIKTLLEKAYTMGQENVLDYHIQNKNENMKILENKLKKRLSSGNVLYYPEIIEIVRKIID